MDELKSAVAEVKLAYNISDYIEQAGVRLKRQGSTAKGLCPFHSEKSPSFSVNDHYQNFRCFGCGASGDLIQFVQQFEHLEFFDALKKLAEEKQIVLNLSNEEKSGVDYSSLRECMRSISNFFFHEYKKLDATHPAKEEVAKRGFSKSKIVHGYAPEGRQTLYKHLKAQGFSDETILLTGACLQFDNQKGLFDFWHGRLMFFITDVTGKPIGWSGRKLYESDKRGKYVNSKDGILFDKSSSLYNIFQAKKAATEAKKIYVNEGQFDVEALSVAGLPNAVASSGTAFTEKQAMILRRLVGEDGRIVFCFDGDKAGRAAAEKVFTSVPLIHSQAYAVALPEGVDPCDYRLEKGSAALVEYLEAHEVPLVEFVLNEAAKKFDLTKELEKTQYVNTAARILRTLNNNLLRETYMKKVSLNAFVSIAVVKDAIRKAEPLTKDVAPTVTTTLPVEEAPEETKTLEELKALVSSDEYYSLCARLLALTLEESTLVDGIKRFGGSLPNELKPFAKELYKMSRNEPFIPERFSDSSLASWLMMNDFFPFSHLMGEKEELFEYLIARLEDTLEAKQRRYVKAKVASVLAQSPNQGAGFLEKALEAEERGIKETTKPKSA